MFLRLTSLLVAVASGCVSAFALFWAVLCIFYGGPDGRVGSEATIAGLGSAVIGFATAFVAYVFYTATAKVEHDPDARLPRLALRSSPLLALFFVALLWNIGPNLVNYFLVIFALVFVVKWVAARASKDSVS